MPVAWRVYETMLRQIDDLKAKNARHDRGTSGLDASWAVRGRHARMPGQEADPALSPGRDAFFSRTRDEGYLAMRQAALFDAQNLGEHRGIGRTRQGDALFQLGMRRQGSEIPDVEHRQV